MKKNILKRVILTAAIGLFASSVFAAANCPEKTGLEVGLKSVFKKEIEISNISSTPVDNLCQVQVKFMGQNNIIYTDTKGEYFIPGQILRVSDGVNLTGETLKELNRLSMDDMKKLDNMVAFTLGKSGKSFYFVTDPQCPYCKKAEEAMAPLAEKGEFQVKFLLYPLPFHKGAKEESIAIICDKKGLEGLKINYKSENQCAEGKKKIEDTVNFLSSKGISATPTYIFSDGIPQSGAMEEAKLKEKLNSLSAEAKGAGNQPAKK
jgi:thiol:disulfide interchange protein DsbC